LILYHEKIHLTDGVTISQRGANYKVVMKNTWSSMEVSSNFLVIIESTLHCFQWNVSWCTEISCKNRGVVMIEVVKTGE